MRRPSTQLVLAGAGFLAACAAFFPAPLHAQTPVPCTGPLTETAVIKLAASGVPEPRLVLIVKTCGASFALTKDSESRLRAAGATDAVIAALRDAAPKPKPHPAPPPKPEPARESPRTRTATPPAEPAAAPAKPPEPVRVWAGARD